MESLINFLYNFKNIYGITFLSIFIGLLFSYIDSIISDEEKSSSTYTKEAFIYGGIGALAFYVQSLKMQIEPRFTGPPNF